MQSPGGAAALDDAELPALFWDTLPDPDSAHPDAVALQSVIDESTPAERAAGFKEQGNTALRVGLAQRKKFYLRQAVELYGRGLELRPEGALAAALHGNRAHVHLLLCNNRAALDDARAALAADPGSVKAAYRGAKAAAGLGRHAESAALAAAGLALEPGNAELAALAAAAAAAEARRAGAAAAAAAAEEAAAAPARALAAAIAARGWRVGRPQFAVGARRPWLEPAGAGAGAGGEAVVHWPALFFYPEGGMACDVVEDMGEHDRLGDHLDAMFGPLDAAAGGGAAAAAAAPPPLEWDAARRYRRDNVEVYYLSHAATPLGAEALADALRRGWSAAPDAGPARHGAAAAGWVRAPERAALGELLAAPDCVVPGVPAFFVLARDSPLRDAFLSGDLPIL